MAAEHIKRNIDDPDLLAGSGWAGALLLLILLGTIHPVFSILAFMMAAVFIIRREQYGMLLLFLIMPFAGIFKLGQGRTSLFTYLELVFVFGYFARRKFLLTGTDLILIVLAFCMTVTELMSGVIAITNTVKVLVNVLILEQFLMATKAETRKKLFLWFVAGIILSSVVSAFGSSIFPVERYVVVTQIEQHGHDNFVKRFTGLSSDPNYYTINVILSLCLLIELYRHRDLSVFQTCVLMGTLVFFAAATGSKSALLMLGVVALIFLYACLQSRRYLLFFIGVASMALGVSTILSGQLEAFNGILTRLKGSVRNINALTTGRVAIWKQYMNYFQMHPIKALFGNGVGIYLLNGVAAHNTYLDMIYQLGIIGTIAYLACIFSMIGRVKQHFHRTWMHYAGFLCVLMMYFFLSQLQGYDLPFQITACVLLWNNNDKKSLEEVEGQYIREQKDRLYI